MNGKQIKKLIWETNTPPPTNYIWVKPNGKPYEFNNNTRKWEESNYFGGISENMSEEEQMEVRKNLGLYYEETSFVEKTAKYTDEEIIYGTNVYAKISDDTPSKEDIVSFAGDTGDNLYMHDFPRVVGYNVMAASLPMAAEILVVLEESGGYEAGIYYNKIGISNKETAILVYKGQTTTISKIDAKFLPEQEGGSSLKWLDVTSLPSTDGDEVDISSNISQSDYNDLLDGKYIGIHMPPDMFTKEYYYPILSIVKATNFVRSSIILGNFGIVGFDADDQLNKVLYLIGSDVTRMYVRSVTLINEVPEPVVLSALPETSMTTQVELDAIGLTAANIGKLVNGKAFALCLKNSYGLITTHLNLEVAEYLAVNNYDLRFTDKTHRYSVANAFNTITITKTALS